MKASISILFIFLATIMVLVFLSSCENETITTFNPEEQLSIAENQMIKALLCSHYDNCEDEIEINDNSILIENCIHMDKDKFLEHWDENVNQIIVIDTVPHPEDPKRTIKLEYAVTNQSVDSRQKIYSIQNYATQSKVRNLKYFVHPSVDDCGGYDWVPQIRDAAVDIVYVYGCNFTISRAYAIENADIIFACDNDIYFENNSPNHYDLPTYDDTRSSWCWNRKVGRYISINDSAAGVSNKRGIIIHEILHTLGVAHTNNSFGYHLIDSPTADSNSLMNSGTVNVNELSEDDKNALRRVWPSLLYKPNSYTITKSGNNANLTFNNPYPFYFPYDRVVVAHWFQGSFDIDWIYTQPNSSGTYNYQRSNLPPGQHWFKLLGGSHNHEIRSDATSWKPVVI